MNLKKKSIEYFECFSKKDIYNLRNFFSDEIYLRDWQSEIQGIDKVIELNQKTFQLFNSIEVKPLNIYEDNNHVIAELEILFNKKEKIFVLDILKFNSQNKIISIKAFKG